MAKTAYHGSRVVLATSLVLLGLIISGCSSVTSMFRKDSKIKYADSKHRAVRCLCLWQPAEGNWDNKPVRGFAGQLFFLSNNGGDPVAIRGDVRVYVFDDQGDESEQAKPVHTFDFNKGAFNHYLTKTQFGPAYNIFIPYTRTGQTQTECAVRLRLVEKDGTSVFSEMVYVTLPGTNPNADGEPAGISDKLVKQATKKKTSTVALDDSLEAKLKAWQAKQKTSRRVKTVGGTFKPTVTTDTQSGPARLSAATARPIKHPFRPRHVLARSEVDSDPSTTGGTKHKQALYEVTGLLRESHNAADRGAFDEAIRIASRADWLSRQEGLSTQHENPTKLVAGWEISRIDKSSPQTAAARKTLIDARVDDYLRASQQQSKSGNDSEAKRLATVGHMLAKTTDSAKPAAGKTHPLSSAPSPKFHHPLSSPASKPFQPKHPLQSPEPGQ